MLTLACEFACLIGLGGSQLLVMFLVVGLAYVSALGTTTAKLVTFTFSNNYSLASAHLFKKKRSV